MGGKNIDHISQKLNLAAGKFQYWCQLNKLTLNTSKSKLVLYNNRLQINKLNIDIKIGDVRLELVSEYKYSGVILDSKLQFVSHINSVKQRISYRMATLRKVRWSLGYKEALTLYKSCILPYFDQGSLYFDCAVKDILKGLQTFQNKCLRLVTGKKRWEGTQEAHRKANLLSVADRRNLSLLKFAHKQSYDRTNLREVHDRSMRSNRRLLLKEPRSNCRQFDKSFVLKSTKMWNNIPEDYKKIRNIHSFKNHVKIEMLLNNINFPE